MPYSNLDPQGAVPQAAQQPAQQPPAPVDPNADLKAYFAKANPQAAALMASGRYDPAQLSQVMAPPTQAAPPAGGQPQPGAGYSAPMPPGYAAPMGFAPQLYNAGNAPVNVQMQQLPNGMSVPQDQAGQAKQALGLDRLPGYADYLQQQRLHNTQLPGALPMSQDQMLAQYTGLQKVQAENDLQGTNRMNAANLGAYQQGQNAIDQGKLTLSTQQASLPYMSALSAINGVNSGQVDSFQAQKNQSINQQLASGVGGPLSGQQAPAPSGAPPQQGPAPGGTTAPPRGGDPLMNADPKALEYAFDTAAKEGAPRGLDGKPAPRSQADTIVQFENAHPGLLKQSPAAFNSLASYLSREGQGGDPGLQSLWRTTHTLGERMGAQPTPQQRAQTILQQAAEAHTGMTTPISTGTGIPLFGSQPIGTAGATPRAASPVQIKEHGFRQ